MTTAYFLGAGAAAADGLPLTRQLNFGVSAYMRTQRERCEHLADFYMELYGVSEDSVESDVEHWNNYMRSTTKELPREQSSLPDLIETLSLIDVCIADEQSLGPSRRRDGGRRRKELDPNHLREVRAQLTMAVAWAVQQSTIERRLPVAMDFVNRLAEDDTIVSTNWDMAIERCLVENARAVTAGSLKRAPIRYHCVGERPVDCEGHDIEFAESHARSLLKLHGGINWFGCACCGNVYVNLEQSWIIDPKRYRPVYDECHCGAGLLNVMIAPSYIKDYRSISLRSVWREAQKRLEQASRWVFIGYSLPSDDYHIRAMLMRAMRARLRALPFENPQLKVVAVLAPGDHARGRYEDLFRVVGCQFVMSGFEGFLDQSRCL